MNKRYKLIPTPIQFVKKINKTQFFIKRDDTLDKFSFGTKIRKFDGLYQYLKNQDFSSVLLFGNLHSNYLAAFSYLFLKYKIPFVVFAYSKDINLKTFNSSFVEKSLKLFKFNSYKKMCFEMEFFLNKNQRIIKIPEYSLHYSSLKGLDSLSEEIFSFPIFFHQIFVDVGSGLTYLALYKKFKERVKGICIGSNKTILHQQLKKYANQFSIVLEHPNLISCQILPKFGKVNQKLISYSNDYFQSTNIPIEPVYSAKSIYTIEEILKQNKCKQNILYIHQGGIYNFLKIKRQNFNIEKNIEKLNNERQNRL